MNQFHTSQDSYRIQLDIQQLCFHRTMAKLKVIWGRLKGLSLSNQINEGSTTQHCETVY